MNNINDNPCLGSSFEDHLKEAGLQEETKDGALKIYLSYQVRMALHEAKITQTELAKRMATSRAAVRRILDPGNPAITLATIRKVAEALGKKVYLTLK